MKIRGTHLLVLLAMCGLIASGVGLVTNVAGLFFTPVADALNIGKGEVSMTLTICNIAFALGGMAAPHLMSERYMKLVTIGATAALAASTAALSLCGSIIPMYLLSALRGFSAGVIGMVFATTVVGNWFHANLGLVTSITFGCSGLAGAAFNPVMAAVIAAMGWRAGYVVLAILTVILNLPAILFVPSLDPKTKGLLPFGDDGTKASDQKKVKGPSPAPAIDAKINPLLFALVFAYAVICSGITAMPQHFSGFADATGMAAVGATMVSVCMIANTGGKVALGALVDRIGARMSCLIVAALVGTGCLLMLFVRTPATMIAAAALYGFCYSLATVGISMITRAVFGDANYSRVYPTMSLGGNMANAVFSSIVGFMYDFSGGYGLPLWTMTFMTAVTAVLIVAAFSHHEA